MVDIEGIKAQRTICVNSSGLGLGQPTFPRFGVVQHQSQLRKHSQSRSLSTIVCFQVVKWQCQWVQRVGLQSLCASWCHWCLCKCCFHMLRSILCGHLAGSLPLMQSQQSCSNLLCGFLEGSQAQQLESPSQHHRPRPHVLLGQSLGFLSTQILGQLMSSNACLSFPTKCITNFSMVTAMVWPFMAPRVPTAQNNVACIGHKIPTRQHCLYWPKACHGLYWPKKPSSMT